MRGRHDNAPGHVADQIHRRDRFIAGPRRQVHEEIIQLLPFHPADELVDELIFICISPDDGIIGILQEEGHGGDFDVIGLERDDAAAGADLELLAFPADHFGDIRTMYVHVHHADLFAKESQTHGEIRGDGAFSDAALVAHDEDLVTDDGHPLVHEPAAVTFLILLAGLVLIA